MRGFKAVLGYTAAGLVLALTFLTPFVLLPRLTRMVGASGLRPHPRFAGGAVVRTVDRGAYRVAISAPAGPLGLLERTPRFVQVSWGPLGALPARVEETLDLDGDGHPDVGIAFAVPEDPAAPLLGKVTVLDPAKVRPATEAGRGFGHEVLLVRLGDRIVARFPVKP